MHLCQEVFAILILWQARLSKRNVTVWAADNTSAFSHVFPLEDLAVQGFVRPIIFHFYLLSWFKVKLTAYSYTVIFLPLPEPKIGQCWAPQHRDLLSQGAVYGALQGGITIFSWGVLGNTSRIREEWPRWWKYRETIIIALAFFFKVREQNLLIFISLKVMMKFYWVLCGNDKGDRWS